MSANKLPRHADLDAEILTINSPVKLALQLGCLASILLTVIAWLGLVALMTADVLEWALWPYVAAPIAGWVILLGLPALLSARRGALATLDALATTAEAWLARAGYSVDLNNDGTIGYTQPIQIEPPQTQIVRPAVWSGPGGVKLLAQDAPAIPQVAAQPAEDDAPPPPMASPGHSVVRQVWELPGEVRCPRETVETFVERIFIVGWGRGEWVGPGKPLEREVYDALLNLLSQAQVIEGRKAGYAGRLTVDDPATAKRILGLRP